MITRKLLTATLFIILLSTNTVLAGIGTGGGGTVRSAKMPLHEKIVEIETLEGEKISGKDILTLDCFGECNLKNLNLIETKRGILYMEEIETIRFGHQ